MPEQDDIFPDPHGDEASGDAVVEPEEEFADEEVGSSPVEEARKPRRRWAIFLVVGAVVAIGGFFLFVGGNGEDTNTAANQQQASGEINQAQRAQTPQEAAQQQAGEEDPLDQQAPEQEAAPSAEEGEDFVGAENMEEEFDFSTPQQPGQGQQPTGQASGQDTSLNRYFQEGGQGQQPTGDNPLAGRGQQGQGSQPRRLTPEELERQRMLDSLRIAQQQEEAEEQEKEQARQQLEERLRSQGTEIAAGNVDLSATNQGQSRFSSSGGQGGAARQTSGSQQGGQAGVIPGNGGQGRTVPSGQEETGVEFNLLPGSRARAVTTSKFISDQQGAGRVQARLTSPLRTRDGDVVLPVGTKAFGDANAAGGVSAGEDARVSIDFSTFVRPDGSVIRDLQGVAANPETMATTIEADVDDRLLERVLRGGASIALDFALTSGADDRRSAFEAPSPRDQAINDARQRAVEIVGGRIGDEQSRQPAITLEQGTELILMFGLP